MKKPHPPTRAFRRSAGYTFRGKKLEPFGFVRQGAFFSLTAQMGSTPLVEMAILIWLLQQPDSVCHQARRDPEAAIAKVDKFAEEQGITMGGKNLPAAKSLYRSIISDLRSTRVTPGPPPGSDGEEEDDESGN